MKWILIFWLAHYPPMTATEFNSGKDCEYAAAQLKRERSDVRYVCVPKGDGRQ